MSDSTVIVDFKEKDSTQLPERFHEGVALLLALKQAGNLDAIKESFRIRREGGFSGFDIFLFLLYTFASEQLPCIGSFARKAKDYKPQLAAIAERSSLPSAASVSRALAQAESSLINEPMNQMLVEYSGALQVISHPVCQTYDAMGKGWHIFDFDPTVTTLRQRALPQSPELPQPQRRSQHLKSGYKGRKRGDVQLKRATLQHHGSGAWIGAWYDTGNGNARKEISLALEAIQKTCLQLPQPCERVLIRADGEFGTIPCLTACQQANIHIITRLTRPSWFKKEAFLKEISEMTWKPVPDSKSGPKREAVDLGWTVLQAASTTLQDDGTPFEPLEVRVVLSRFKPKGKSSSGTKVKGWQFELFVTTVKACDWPAEEVVCAYFGRTAEENRFMQEDRELNLDHIFSYHIPGQELAVQIGLFVWNMRISLGFSMNPPPYVIPVQPDPPQHEEPDQPDPAEKRKPASKEEPLQKEKAHLTSFLNKQDWAALLKRRSGWTWDPLKGKLLCPTGHPMTLSSVTEEGPKDHVKGYFRGSLGMCDGCPNLSQCYQRRSNAPTKVASFLFPSGAVSELKSLLAAASPRYRSRSGNVRIKQKGSDSPLVFRPSGAPGSKPIHHSLFLPANARQLLRSGIESLNVFVEVHQGSHRASPSHPLIANSIAERRHQRKSWAEHLARYALVPGSLIHITLTGAASLRPLLFTGLNLSQLADTG